MVTDENKPQVRGLKTHLRAFLLREQNRKTLARPPAWIFFLSQKVEAKQKELKLSFVARWPGGDHISFSFHHNLLSQHTFPF